jgi:hypothetical protein
MPTFDNYNGLQIENPTPVRAGGAALNGNFVTLGDDRVANAAHIANTSNPHNVTAAQVGAVPKATTLTVPIPFVIDGASSKDLSANRTLGFINISQNNFLAGNITGGSTTTPHFRKIQATDLSDVTTFTLTTLSTTDLSTFNAPQFNTSDVISEVDVLTFGGDHFFGGEYSGLPFRLMWDGVSMHFDDGAYNDIPCTFKGVFSADALRIGNTVAATTLGSVIGAAEVFDSNNGDSIGFIPIYDSIT